MFGSTTKALSEFFKFAHNAQEGKHRYHLNDSNLKRITRLINESSHSIPDGVNRSNRMKWAKSEDESLGSEKLNCFKICSGKGCSKPVAKFSSTYSGEGVKFNNNPMDGDYYCDECERRNDEFSVGNLWVKIKSIFK